jgi:type III secretion protein L
MLLIGNPDFTLTSDRRLVKASEVATVKSAAEIVAAAEAEAARIREEAKAAFEEERKRGFEKGLQDGKLEIAMQKLEQVDQSVAFMESVEGKMADIVMKALKSCVVEIGDREMVVNIVRKTMNAVIRTQRHVTLKVAPEMVAAVKERVSALRVDYPTVETFDVVEDPRLKGPACILETEAGVADASVETQLEAIERSMARHLSGKNGQTGDSGKGAGA